MYKEEAIPGVEIDNDVFVLDSTTISVSLVLMEWAHGKYSRGAVKMHTLLDLRGSIPTFIHVSDGKLNGLLKCSCIPDREIRELRDLTRYRKKLTYMVSSEKNRFQKILEDANIKLSVVLSDVFGKTGRKMIQKIVYGEDYDPQELLRLLHGRVKAERSDIKEALTGYVTDHHRSSAQGRQHGQRTLI